jgi:hypothetical protein
MLSSDCQPAKALNLVSRRDTYLVHTYDRTLMENTANVERATTIRYLDSDLLRTS